MYGKYSDNDNKYSECIVDNGIMIYLMKYNSICCCIEDKRLEIRRVNNENEIDWLDLTSIGYDIKLYYNVELFD